MKTTLHRLLIICCALYLSGAHWMVLQTAAWTGMVVSRSVSTSVSEALETTFDGKHPCRMCKSIERAHQEERQADRDFKQLKEMGDLKFLEFERTTLLSSPAPASFSFPKVMMAFASRSEAPPTPPPLG